MSSIQTAILRQMMGDSDYAVKYLDTLKADYFEADYKPAFKALSGYINKYQRSPSKEELIIAVHGQRGEFDESECIEAINEFDGDPLSGQWILDETEAFIRKQYTHSNVMATIDALGKDKPIAEFANRLLTPPAFGNECPGIDSESPDFFEQLRAHNQQKADVIPFDIDWLNRSVQGVRRKTLNVVLAGTNVGKSMFLCHLAASYLRRKLNVLYLSMEMDEWIVQNRVHANLLDISLEPDSTLTVPDDITGIENIGRLVVRSYPTGTGHVGHFRSYLADLKTKRKFIPDVIVIDYLAICASERSNDHTQHHIMIGNIAKECRSLAQITDTVVWTATQANRAGMTKGTSVGLTHTADSIQIGYDADLILSLWQDENIPDRLHCSIEKQRNGAGAGKHGLLAVDRSRMKVYDLSDAEVADHKAVLDKFKIARSTTKKAKLDDVVFDIDREAA